jgi:hypothetical protein
MDMVLIRQPSRIRSHAEACGLISYVAMRELGYREFKVGKELNCTRVQGSEHRLALRGAGSQEKAGDQARDHARDHGGNLQKITK